MPAPVLKHHVLIVDDDPTAIQTTGRCVMEVADVRFADTGVQALQTARAWVPDLILLDAQMEGMNGFEVCRALKADPLLEPVPVIFITGRADAEAEAAGFDAGAVDFVGKPVNPRLLLARVQTHLKLKRLSDQLRVESRTDALTGVANRRAFDNALAHEWSVARRTGDPISLPLVDIDRLKAFNDRWGHPLGDRCLRAVAVALEAGCHRPADLVARYGGEEFALLLPKTDRDGARRVAQRALQAVAALLPTSFGANGADPVSVSVGIGFHDRRSAGWVAPSADSRGQAEGDLSLRSADLVHAADAAMYEAKRAGRAQAWYLDASDADMPGAARPVGAGADAKARP